MVIRHAMPSDREGIANIHIESWKDAYANVLPSEFLDSQIDDELNRHWSKLEIKSDDIVMVAEEEVLIGFIAVWCRPVPFIDNLHVKPSFRSKNVGSTLLTAAAVELMDKGYQTAHLWVFEKNEKAIRFYQQFGGTLTKRAHKNIFGFKVPSRKIEWENLAVIYENS